MKTPKAILANELYPLLSSYKTKKLTESQKEYLYEITDFNEFERPIKKSLANDVVLLAGFGTNISEVGQYEFTKKTKKLTEQQNVTNAGITID